MARELLSVLRFAVVAALPGTAAKGDGCVLSGDGHLYVYDGAAWVDHGAPHAETTQVDGSTGQLDDYDTNAHRILKFTAGGVEITGLVAPGAGQPRVVHIIAPATCILHDQSTVPGSASAAANRIALGVYAPNVTIVTGTLIYDEDDTIWRPAAAF